MSTGAIGGTSAPAAATGFGALTSDKFIKVLLSELSQQDPFQPQDSSKLLEQLSSLRNIESQLQLQDKLESLVLQNQISTAGGLIGKLVKGINDANDHIQGAVTSIRVEDGNVLLELDTGKTLAMKRVTEITDLATNP